MPIAQFGYIQGMDQQRIDRIGLACLTIACVLGGAAITISVSYYFFQANENEAPSYLMGIACSHLLICLGAIYSTVAPPKQPMSTSDKKSRLIVMSLILTLLFVLNVLVLSKTATSFQLGGKWNASTAMGISSGIGGFAFGLFILGTVLRIPTKQIEKENTSLAVPTL